jgi:hypothetical protein
MAHYGVTLTINFTHIYHKFNVHFNDDMFLVMTINNLCEYHIIIIAFYLSLLSATWRYNIDYGLFIMMLIIEPFKNMDAGMSIETCCDLVWHCS